jgi:hypothetical protein
VRSPPLGIVICNFSYRAGLGRVVRHQPQTSSFEEYWLASKAWERKGLPLGDARALANAGFLKMDDLHLARASSLK